jgi:hypothetical protein
VLVFGLDAMRWGWPRVRVQVIQHVKRFRLLAVESFDELQVRVSEAPYRHGPWYYPLCVASFLLNGKLLFLAASLAAAILGLTASPFCFGFGLLAFAGKSPEIRIVATALSRNTRAIASTVIFMTIIVYLYSVWGYKYLADLYFYMDFNEEAVPICTSLLQCFLTALNDGLRANDLGASIERIRSADIVAMDTEQELKYYVQVRCRGG